jgi:hypothetical protein
MYEISRTFASLVAVISLYKNKQHYGCIKSMFSFLFEITYWS